MPLPIDFGKLDARDVLDIAVFVEREAHERYEELAAEMDRTGSVQAGEFFRAMAVREARHGDRLAQRRMALFGDAPRRFEDRVVWDIEAPDYGTVFPAMGLRKALEVALASEIKAHDYYAAAALEHFTEAGVGDLLEDLRRAELEHRRLVEGELAKLG
jgi:erythrin-vacuolar iron transport family protein